MPPLRAVAADATLGDGATSMRLDALERIYILRKTLATEQMPQPSGNLRTVTNHSPAESPIRLLGYDNMRVGYRGMSELSKSHVGIF